MLPAGGKLLIDNCPVVIIAAAVPVCELFMSWSVAHRHCHACLTTVRALSMARCVVICNTDWSLAAVFCLQSFDLQRVLEGEKALRSEATRQLKEVEKKLVSLRSPAVALSSPMPAPPGSERTLEADKAMLQDQIKAHSAQVCFTCLTCPRTSSIHVLALHVVLEPSTCHGSGQGLA